MVEAARIELASENPSPRLSPSAVFRLRFPSSSAGKRAIDYGSRYFMTEKAALFRSRAPLIDALTEVAVVFGRTGA